MTKKVRLRPPAKTDFKAAVRWYNDQRNGLGRAFEEDVQRVLDRIQQMPRLYAKVYGEYRAAPLHVFEYTVYYREAADAVVVIAIVHNARDPNVWQSRAD